MVRRSKGGDVTGHPLRFANYDRLAPPCMDRMQTLPAAILCLALLYAAWGDIRSRTIPNGLNAAIAIGAGAWWWAGGYAPWPDIAVQVGLCLVIFAVFAVCFAFGAMGGGDVKLIAVIALWLRPSAMLTMLQIMAIAGGVLTLVVLVDHKRRQRTGRPEVPYGVAIAGATLWIVTNDILTAFGHE